MQGQPPAQLQHCRDGDTASSVVPNKPWWHQTNAKPLGLPAQVCFHWLQTPVWPGVLQKGDGGTRDGQRAMLQPRHACLQDVPAGCLVKPGRGGQL